MFLSTLQKKHSLCVFSHNLFIKSTIIATNELTVALNGKRVEKISKAEKNQIIDHFNKVKKEQYYPYLKTLL